MLDSSNVVQGLQLTQQKLSHEKYMEEALQHVKALEAEVKALEAERTRREGKTSAQTSVTSTKKSYLWC